MAAILKKKWRFKFFFYVSIMLAKYKYPKISMYIAIGQSWHFCDMEAILKKNGGSEKKSR